MFDSTLYPKTKQVLTKLAPIQIVKQFYLAGGTGLALQLGHRKSIDLDLFTRNYPKNELLLAQLKSFSPRITQQAEGTLDVIIDQVKVSFLEYDYPLIADKHQYQRMDVADVKDIACMKLTAISSRGSKKDFVDLYFILQDYTLDQIWTWFEQKYKEVDYQKLHMLKSIVYFDDADQDPEVNYLEPVEWAMIKQSLVNKISALASEKLGFSSASQI